MEALYMDFVLIPAESVSGLGTFYLIIIAAVLIFKLVLRGPKK